MAMVAQSTTYRGRRSTWNRERAWYVRAIILRYISKAQPDQEVAGQQGNATLGWGRERRAITSSTIKSANWYPILSQGPKLENAVKPRYALPLHGLSLVSRLSGPLGLHETPWPFSLGRSWVLPIHYQQTNPLRPIQQVETPQPFKVKINLHSARRPLAPSPSGAS